MKTIGFYVTFECEDDEMEVAQVARYVIDRLEHIGLVYDGIELTGVWPRDID